MKKELIKLIATGFYSGYGRPFPGTWGTIPALLIAFFLIGDNQVILAAVAVLTFIVSVWTANEAEGFFGHDARRIVIDEWAGMFVTVLFVPYSPVNYIIAFI
ncbi:MAG: phosphatidylglycerophosphatase A, partial [candidate division Zixibacteria bacterium]|nr:phosphatidylglycerophosphatase A [candidate division Zixibacteria bacterium]